MRTLVYDVACTIDGFIAGIASDTASLADGTVISTVDRRG